MVLMMACPVDLMLGLVRTAKTAIALMIIALIIIALVIIALIRVKGWTVLKVQGGEGRMAQLRQPIKSAKDLALSPVECPVKGLKRQKGAGRFSAGLHLL